MQVLRATDNGTAGVVTISSTSAGYESPPHASIHFAGICVRHPANLVANDKYSRCVTTDIFQTLTRLKTMTESPTIHKGGARTNKPQISSSSSEFSSSHFFFSLFFLSTFANCTNKNTLIIVIPELLPFCVPPRRLFYSSVSWLFIALFFLDALPITGVVQHIYYRTERRRRVYGPVLRRGSFHETFYFSYPGFHTP